MKGEAAEETGFPGTGFLGRDTICYGLSSESSDGELS